MSKRLLGLLLVIVAAIAWIIQWSEQESRRFDHPTHWKEIPRTLPSETVAEKPTPPLPYQVTAQPPWEKSLSPGDSPLRQFGMPEQSPRVTPEGGPAAPPAGMASDVEPPEDGRREYPQAAGPAKEASLSHDRPAGGAGRPLPDDPLRAWVEAILPALLESTLPIFVETAMQRLDTFMAAAGETKLTRRFSQEEFDQMVVQHVAGRAQGQLGNVTARIEDGGLSGSGAIRLGQQKLDVSIQFSVAVVQERPHLVLRGMHVGDMEISQPTLKILEHRVNAFIDRQRYPLRLKEFRSHAGWIWMSVERV